MPVNFADILNQNLRHLGYIMPETVVVATFLLALVFDFAVAAERRKSTGYLCIVGLLVALWLAGQNLAHVPGMARTVFDGQSGTTFLAPVLEKSIFSGMLVYDHFGTFFKIILLLGTIVTLILAIHAREISGKNEGEFYLLLVAVCAGGMFLASASNLLMIYLSLESLSILSYVLAGYLRQDRKSAEAGIKYVIYGAMASGIMIFGMSYLYGLTGTLNLYDYAADPHRPAQLTHGIASQIIYFDPATAVASRGGLIAILAMVFSGFLYKIAAVPFHYWSPDVYEGAPTTATGFFSVVPKAAGFAVLIRVLCKLFPASLATPLPYSGVETAIAVLAVLTMTLGNLAALGQSNAKRMLAYSSIAHAGYMLAGLSVLDNGVGPAAVLYYLIVYLVMNLGAFLALVALENVFGGCELWQLRGAVRREPVLAIALCIFLFSLTGIPPLAGFMGKYLIMWKLADRGHFLMIFWIGINSVISLYYYMKLAKTVTIDRPEAESASTVQTPLVYNALAVLKSVALLLLFFYFDPIQQMCRQLIAPLR
jgi:NADH-quinone oxidoreductase subunit N